MDSKPGTLPCFCHSLFHCGQIISPVWASVPPLGNKKFGADNHRQTSAKTDYYQSQEPSSPFFRERERLAQRFFDFPAQTVEEYKTGNSSPLTRSSPEHSSTQAAQSDHLSHSSRRGSQLSSGRKWGGHSFREWWVCSIVKCSSFTRDT